MTENTEKLEEVQEQSGIAILPKTDERPLGIVCIDDTLIEDAEKLSKTLTDMGMDNVLMSIKDAEKEGISKQDLLDAQLKEKINSELLEPLPTMPKTKSGSNKQPKKKKRKKGKKTHRR